MSITDYIVLYFNELWYLTTEMAPYLLLGFLIAGILHVYLPKYKVKKYIGGKTIKASMYASLLGVPLPLCSCGVIPTGVSFYKNGASKGSTVSFLISTPQTGLDSILVTYSLLGLPFAIVRPVIAFVTGVFGGAFTNAFVKDVEGQNETGIGEEDDTIREMSAGAKLKELFNYAFVEFLNDISKWLVIGLLIAALISVVVPEDFFGATINNEYLGLLIMLLASVPMYVCATASVPIAAVLMSKGLSPGAALVFLMAGPATNMATIMVIGKAIGKRTLMLYLISIISGAVFFGLLINEVPLIRQFFSEIPVASAGHSHMLPHWLGYTSSVLLILFMINGYMKMKKPKSKTNVNSDSAETFVKVKGMSCSHCEMNVEKRLRSFEGVEDVSADFKNESVRLKGKNLDISAVNEAINNLGYEVVE